MKRVLLFTSFLVVGQLSAFAQQADLKISVVCVDANGTRAEGTATINQQTNAGTMDLQYMAQLSPKKTYKVSYVNSAINTSLRTSDGKILIADGTNDGNSDNTLTIQEMTGGELKDVTVNPGNCSLENM